MNDAVPVTGRDAKAPVFSAASLFGRMSDRIATVTDFMAFWDYVEGIAEHFDDAKQAELDRFFSDIFESCWQVKWYCELQPDRKPKAVQEHNRRLAEIVDCEWKKLGLKVCCECHLLFVPTNPRNRLCEGCYAMLRGDWRPM